jgi:hypothetical protein
MSPNRPFRVTVPFRRLFRVRLFRVQLRLKIMAGVVALTLIALTAFGIAAVTTMRHYLYGVTDKNLQVALNFTRPQLPFLVKGYPRGGGQGRPQQNTGTPRPVWSPAPYRSVFGGFTIIYLPSHGKQIPLQVAAGGPPFDPSLPPGAAKIAIRPGPQTAAVPGGLAQVRLQGITVRGGSLVAETSLDQVTNTVVRIELIVMLGSVAVVLLIGLGLAIVAEIAAAHGGSAEATPASPHGLRVRATVPVRQDNAERTEVTPSVPVSSPAG